MLELRFYLKIAVQNIRIIGAIEIFLNSSFTLFLSKTVYSSIRDFFFWKLRIIGHLGDISKGFKTMVVTVLGGDNTEVSILAE